jgi:hypothetical protein
MEMNIDIELQGAPLSVTANGAANAHSASLLRRQMCETAAEKGVDKILVDCLALNGELAAFERYRPRVETAECFTGRLMKTPGNGRIRGAAGPESRRRHHIIFDAAGRVERA